MNLSKEEINKKLVVLQHALVNDLEKKYSGGNFSAVYRNHPESSSKYHLLTLLQVTSSFGRQFFEVWIPASEQGVYWDTYRVGGM